MHSSLLRWLFANRDGGAAVEFALGMPVLLLAMLGVVEFGRLLWTQNALHYAVQEAARCMTFDTTTCNNTTNTQTFAASISGEVFPGSVFTPSTSAGGATCGAGISGNKVAASYPFHFSTSLFQYNITLTAQACYPAT